MSIEEADEDGTVAAILEAIHTRAAMAETADEAIRIYVQGVKDQIKAVSEALNESQDGEDDFQEALDDLSELALRLDVEAAVDAITKEDPNAEDEMPPAA